MPKFKGRTTNRGSWTEDNLIKAVKFVIEERHSVRDAANRFNVPKTTLHRRVMDVKNGLEIQGKPKIGRFALTFNTKYETILVNHVKDMSNRMMPLTKKEFQKLAFDLAVSLNIDHRFNVEKKTAGKDFYYAFLKRHPDLSLRSPEATSLARAVGFNKPQVHLLFDKLESLLDLHKFPPSRIFNADETGVSCVHKNERVLSQKGKKQVGKMTSAERGQNVTVMFCMNVIGTYVPPLLIFKRERMNDRLMFNAPDEAVGVAQKNGSMDGSVFLIWLKHFVKHTRPTKSNPVLLILDGHGSHKDLQVILYARENHIHMISTPPHTTHKTQPLDRTFMKPFKSSYNEACSMWMRAHPGARIGQYDIAGLVAQAFTQSARLDIAQKGFQCTGIHPLNRNIFTDLDYLPSMITDIPDHAVNQVTNIVTADSGSSATAKCHDGSPPETSGNVITVVAEVYSSAQPIIAHATPSPPKNPGKLEPIITHATPSPQKKSEKLEPQATLSPSPDTKAAIRILEEISPILNCSKKRIETRKRKAEKSEILTSTPFKNSLEEKAEAQRVKEAKKTKVNKKVNFNSRTKINTKTMRKIPDMEAIQTNPNKDDKYACIICFETFEEDWIQCEKCQQWAHEECADIDETSPNYVCDLCKV